MIAMLASVLEMVFAPSELVLVSVICVFLMFGGAARCRPVHELRLPQVRNSSNELAKKVQKIRLLVIDLGCGSPIVSGF
jgi:hypothetical protein